MALLEAARQQVEAERELGSRMEEYVGKWVALNGQEIVADADTLEGLLAIIDVDNVERVLEVQEASTATCFF